MSDFIKLNGRAIRAAEVDFNYVSMLGENNISLNEIGRKQLPALRVYVAHCTGLDVETAGELINQHIINGGDIVDVMATFGKKCDESAFFRAISSKTEENLIESNEVKEVESEKVTKIRKSKTTEA